MHEMGNPAHTCSHIHIKLYSIAIQVKELERNVSLHTSISDREAMTCLLLVVSRGSSFNSGCISRSQLSTS